MIAQFGLCSPLPSQKRAYAKFRTAPPLLSSASKYVLQTSSGILQIYHKGYSVLILLHSHHGNIRDGLSNRPSKSEYFTAMQVVSRSILPILNQIQYPFSSGRDNPSPIVLGWMYRCLIAFKLPHHDSSPSLNTSCAQAIQQAMIQLSSRWIVGAMNILSYRKYSLTFTRTVLGFATDQGNMH